MANDRPGLEVANYLVARGDTIVRLYIHGEDKAKYAGEIIEASGCADSDVYPAKLLKDAEHVSMLSDIDADWIITVYWSYLISQAVISSAREGTVNFHPALLPVNRGWYPHVHSIIDGTPLGVTLHAIEKDADTGPVWAQKEVNLSPYDTAFSVYNRSQKDIVELFMERWDDISTGRVIPVAQDETKATYHKKAEVDALDHIDPDEMVRAGDLIDLLRARSFGDKGFAHYLQGGEKVFVNIRLSRDTNFK